MSTEEVVAPINVVICDHADCLRTYRSDSGYYQRSGHLVRIDAGKHGWSVRPSYGKGSRTAPDLCPKHSGVKP